MEDDVASRLAGLQFKTPVLIALYDRDDRLQYANEAFRAAFALLPDEKILWADLIRRGREQAAGIVIRSTNLDAWFSATLSRRGKMPYRVYEMDLLDGRWFWMAETVDADGWMLCIASEITSVRAKGRELRQARDFALRASQTDDLTGIANRRFMMQALETMNETVARGDSAHGCLCIFDLDLFKHINDRFGHQVGDQVLKDFALIVQPAVRRRDSFGRIGGEEFMLVMPNTTLPQASVIVKDILTLVRNARPIRALPTLSYTCSAGLAGTIKGETVNGFYARADRALYLAKHGGRDRMEIVA